MLSRKQRVEYLLVTIAAFCSGALLYGGLLYAATEFAYELQLYLEIPDMESFYLTSSDLLHYALSGGFVFSGVVSSAILAARFFARRGLVFKLIAAFLAPLTLLILEIVGLLIYLPYQIYNLIQIIRLSFSKRGGDAAPAEAAPLSEPTDTSYIFNKLDPFDK